MTRRPPKSPETSEAPKGERIAKVLARAGIASRRDAEKIIVEGRVAVNGKVIDSPALNVGPRDKITVDDAPLPEREPARLWLYHKPTGLVTTARDEKGRDTVFDHLPEDMPRVMSVGRLDLNSEGLLLLTNDGELKRQLELPSTGWVRKYRVRVNGEPSEDMLTPVRKGIVIEGEKFQPMSISLDRQQGANAWLTVGLREGKNREIRRAMEAVGLTVNRLIRVSYGPFQLRDLKSGEVEEVKARVLRDQLGVEGEGEDDTPARRKPVRKKRTPGGFGGPGQPGRPKQEPAGRAALQKPGKPSGSRKPAPANAPGSRRSGGASSRFSDPSTSLRGKPGAKSGGRGGPKGGPKGKR